MFHIVSSCFKVNLIVYEISTKLFLICTYYLEIKIVRINVS